MSNAYLRLTSVQKAHRDAMVEQERASLNLIKAEKSITLETEKLKIKRQELIKVAKQQAKEELGLVSAYDKIVAKMNVAGKTVQNLNAKKLSGQKLSDREQKELAQSTREFLRYNKAVLGADASIGRFQRNVGNYPKGLLAAGSAVTNLAAAFGFVGGIQLFSQVLTNAFNRIKEFNSGLLDVSKTTGITGKDLTVLSDDVIKLSNKLGTVGTKSLLQYGTVAGQLGVKGSENILAFSEALAKLETASNIAGEEGGASIARLLTITDGGVENIKEFGDEIVKLGNNFAASEAEILDNATRVAQTTGLYKLGRQEVLAYATATKAIGQQAELTGSSLGKLLTGLDEIRRGGGAGLERVAETAGMTADEFNKLFQEDSGKAMTTYIAGLNKIVKSGGNVKKELSELGVQGEKANVIALLASKGFDTLNSSLDSVANAAGSLDSEFKTASTKLVNQINRISIAWDNFVLNIEDGQGVLGGLVKEAADDFVKNFDRINIIFNENISFVDRWKTAINLNVSNFTNQWIQPFKESTEVLIANTKAISDNTSEINKQNQAFIESYGSLAPFTEEQIRLNKATDDYYFLLSNNPLDANDESQQRTVAFLKEQIKAQQDLLDLTTNRDDAKVIQDRINGYQKEIDAILGVNKARKETIEAIKGSLIFLEKEVALLKEKQSKLAANTKEYFDFEKKVRAAEQAVKDFKDNVALLLIELDGVNAGLKAVGDEAEAIKSIFDIIGDPDFGKIDGLDYNRLNNDLDDFTKNYEAQQKKLVDIQVEYAKQRKEVESELADNLKELGQSVIDSLFQSQLVGIEEEMRLNDERTERLLAANEGNAAAQEEIRRQSNARQEQLERKRLETERKAFILTQAFKAAEIAIDTIKQVAALKAQAAVLAANPITAPLAALALGLIPSVITSGAIAGAAVLAQTIPAFAEGGISEGGDILVNDAKRSNYKEVIVTPKGDVLRPQKRNTVIAPPKGSEIFKSEQSFMDDLRRLTSINNIMFDSDLIKQPQIPSVINIDNGLSKQDFERGISSLKSAINDKEGVNIFIDENGNRVYKTKQGKRTEQLNNIIRLKRKIV